MDLKRNAAERAADLTGDARVLGLGSGSTACRYVEVLGERLAAGELEGIVGIPTSVDTERLARSVGIPLATLDEHDVIDVTVDGADEVDPRLDLTKGAGGALTREKIVACASRRVIIVVDDSKLVERLGTRMPLPVEVVPFGWRTVARRLRDLGAVPELRRAGDPYRTEQGNYILDCAFEGGIADAEGLAALLAGIPGMVEHGLFLGIADQVVVAAADGVRVLDRACGADGAGRAGY